MLSSISGNYSGIQGGHTPQNIIVSSHSNQETLKQPATHNALKSESEKLHKKAINELSKADQATIQKLKNRDNEVRNHEKAHLNAAGGIATSGASFSYITGPDGARYVTGGEVSISTSPVQGDPAATLRKADIIRRAALAPASPSAQDQSVANSASTMGNKARVELVQQKQQASEADKDKSTEESTDNEDQSSEINQNIASNTNDVTGTLIDIAV